jgi:hypothetical protein
MQGTRLWIIATLYINLDFALEYIGPDELVVGNMYKEQGNNIVMGDPTGSNMAECMSYIQKALK